MKGKRLYDDSGYNKLGMKYAQRFERFAKRVVAEAIRDEVDSRDLTLLAFNSTQIVITMHALQVVCEKIERRSDKRRRTGTSRPTEGAK